MTCDICRERDVYAFVDCEKVWDEFQTHWALCKDCKATYDSDEYKDKEPAVRLQCMRVIYDYNKLWKQTDRKCRIGDLVKTKQCCRKHEK